MLSGTAIAGNTEIQRTHAGLSNHFVVSGVIAACLRGVPRYVVGAVNLAANKRKPSDPLSSKLATHVNSMDTCPGAWKRRVRAQHVPAPGFMRAPRTI
jgi:hypothetical protein